MLEQRLAEGKPTRWGHSADFLIEILMRENRLDSCWDVLRRHGASMSIREKLARASEATHPRDVVAFYAERVEQLAVRGGNHAYEEAAQLLARMSKLRDANEQAT